MPPKVRREGATRGLLGGRLKKSVERVPPEVCLEGASRGLSEDASRGWDWEGAFKGLSVGCLQRYDTKMLDEKC